jgi:hypothetical protein
MLATAFLSQILIKLSTISVKVRMIPLMTDTTSAGAD